MHDRRLRQAPASLRHTLAVAVALAVAPAACGGDGEPSAIDVGPRAGREPRGGSGGSRAPGRDGGADAATADGGDTRADSGLRDDLAVAATLENYVFATSTSHAPDFGGPAAADAICNERAADAGLPGRYVAWLSTAEQDARERVGEHARGWVRGDDRPFAVSLQELTRGAVLYPPRLDEHGSELAEDAASLITATGPDGTFYASGAYTDCEGWSAIDAAALYRAGLASAGTTLWTDASSATCARAGRLLCLGVDDAIAVRVEPRTGRLAWLSAAAFVPGAGVPAADAHCAHEAQARGLVGRPVAWLASEAMRAIDRVGSGEAWIRPDGVAITDDAAALLAGATLLAPIDQELGGDYRGTVGVWTGARAPDAEPGDRDHCTGWSASTGDGRYGMSGYTGALFFDSGTLPCSTDYLHVYCLQP